MNLLVIVPSRGRPESIARLWDAWTETADGCADLLVCLDEDDATVDDYFDVLDGTDIRFTIEPRNGFAPRLTDEALRFANSYEALASWGDDHAPITHGWDTALCDALSDLGTGFAYGDDLIQGERCPTACAMTSDIVTTLGWMTPPGFAHMYVDNVWLDLGRAIDRITYLPDVIVEHLHPIARTDCGEPDALVLDANTDEAMRADRERYEAWKADDMPACVEKLRTLL